MLDRISVNNHIKRCLRLYCDRTAGLVKAADDVTIATFIYVSAGRYCMKVSLVGATVVRHTGHDCAAVIDSNGTECEYVLGGCKLKSKQQNEKESTGDWTRPAPPLLGRHFRASDSRA
jgi:hypothetical protein